MIRIQGLGVLLLVLIKSFVSFSSRLESSFEEDGVHRLLFSSVRSNNTRLHRQRISESYQCSEAEIKFQWENYDLVDSNICDNDFAWLMAQMVLRDATVFIDVGGNVGYTAARVFGMWSPGHGFSRKSLKEGIMEDVKENLRSSKGTLDTVCGDGSKSDEPLLCRAGIMPCSFRKQISVFAFDGQTLHVNSTSRVVYKKFPHLHPSYKVNKKHTLVKATFEYINAAVTSHVPAGVTHGFFVEVDHEGGRLVLLEKGDKAPQTKSGEKTILVPVTTIDKFCEERGLQVVDVLKIDAEGADISGTSFPSIPSFYLSIPLSFALLISPSLSFRTSIFLSISPLTPFLLALFTSSPLSSLLPYIFLLLLSFYHFSSLSEYLSRSAWPYTPFLRRHLVMQGAVKTLSTRRVKLLTAEVNFKNDLEWYAQVKLLDEQFHFDCYMNGRYHTMLRCTNCMNASLPTDLRKYPLCNEGDKCAEYIKWGQRSISGNMYCVSRLHAPALAQAYFSHSLVKYAHKRTGRGHVIKDAMLGLTSGSVGPGDKLSIGNVDAFVRYHGRDPETGTKKWYRS